MSRRRELTCPKEVWIQDAKFKTRKEMDGRRRTRSRRGQEEEEKVSRG